MLKSTRHYIYFLVFITIVEFILAIPLVTDFLVGEPSTMIYAYIPILLHIFALFYIGIGYTEYYTKSGHIFGTLAVVTNSMFPLGFSMHLISFIFCLIKVLKIKKTLALKEKIREQNALLESEYTFRKQLESDDLEDEDADIDDYLD